MRDESVVKRAANTAVQCSGQARNEVSVVHGANDTVVVQIVLHVIREQRLAGHRVQDWLVDCRGANSVVCDVVVLVVCISDRRDVDRRLHCEPAIHAEAWRPLVQCAGEAILPHLV